MKSAVSVRMYHLKDQKVLQMKSKSRIKTDLKA